MFKFKLITILTALIVFQAKASAENIIDLTYGAGAGSFELGTYAGGSFAIVAPGDSTTITGWTVGGPGDGINWLSAPTFRADSGRFSIDLKNLTNSSISTIIPTTIGATYELTFGAASVIGLDNTGLVSAGSLINEAFEAPFSDTFANQTFATFVYQFTALDSTTTIRFEATGNNSPPSARYGPAIDSVSVRLLAIPEPSSLISAALGLAWIVGYAGWRRVRVAKTWAGLA